MSLATSSLVKKGLSYAARHSELANVSTHSQAESNRLLAPSASSLQRQIDEIKTTVEKLETKIVPELSKKVDDAQADYPETV